MINFFVEKKNEYTINLVNVLSPLIYEGLTSIYTEALNVSNCADNILKVFQSFLRKIPKWTPEMINQETDRILKNSKSDTWLSNLVKATIKTNMIILTYNPHLKLQNKIDPKYYKNINLEDFIHKIYIECARELWNNPYLMYHQYPPIELKRNQRDTIILVKDAIKEAIRRLLPLKELLEIYLDDELEQNDIPDFDRNITEIGERNIQKLINKDLKEELINKDSKEELINKDLKEELINKDLKEELINKSINNQSEIKQEGGNYSQTSIQKDLNSKILDIINNDKINDEKVTANIHSENYTNNSSSDTSINKQNKNLSDTSDSNSHHSNNLKMTGGNIEDKIKKVLENDLGASDLETSLSYRPETNDKEYQEIFANSIAPQPSKNQNQIGGNSIKDSTLNKRKFFNNYLNI
jgi:hypothetical protein